MADIEPEQIELLRIEGMFHEPPRLESFELKAQHIRMIGDLGYAGVSKNDINNKDPWKAYGYSQMDRIWTERIAGHFSLP